MVSRRLGPSARLETVLDLAESMPSDGEIPRSVLLDRLSCLPCDFRIGRQQQVFTAEEAAKTPFCNESVYLVKKKALDYGMEHLAPNNAQGELYLTDAIGAIFNAAGENGPRYRVGHVSTEDRFEVMSYNNPEELLQIEDHFHGQRQQSLADLRNRLGAEKLKTVGEWLALFPGDGPVPPSTRAAWSSLTARTTNCWPTGLRLSLSSGELSGAFR